MKRGEIYWADLAAPMGRRPVVIVTRARALSFLQRVTVAPITTTIRGVRSEVRLGRKHGLPHASVAGCDSLLTIDRRTLDKEPAGRLRRPDLRSLDRALLFALGIRC